MVQSNNDGSGEATRRTYLGAAGTLLGATGLLSGTAAASECDHSETDACGTDRVGIDGCTTIDEPGEYELTADLAAAGEGACLRITAGDVSVAGNGYTISGDGSATGILVEDTADVSIADVAVENLDRGIGTENSRGTRIRAVEATAAPVVLDSNSRSSVVSDSTLEDCDIEVVGGSRTLVQGNTLTDAPGNGVFLEATFAATLVGNTISGSEVAGISLDEVSDSQISRNEISDNGGPGIDFDEAFENTAYLNDITDNDGAGVELRDADNNQIADNDLGENGDGPCDVGAGSADNRFEGNDPECEQS